MPYPFLSDEWLEEARRIRAEYEGKGTSIPHVVRMNLVVTERAVRRQGHRRPPGHLEGELELDTGHLDEPDLKVTVDYDTAKAILVEGNPQAGMQAFMAGKIRVEGDMAKLMALQTAPPGADSSRRRDGHPPEGDHRVDPSPSAEAPGPPVRVPPVGVEVVGDLAHDPVDRPPAGTEAGVRHHG